jgi:hypothetical protein
MFVKTESKKEYGELLRRNLVSVKMAIKMEQVWCG